MRFINDVFDSSRPNSRYVRQKISFPSVGFFVLLTCSNTSLKKKKFTRTRIRFGYNSEFVRIHKNTVVQRLRKVAVLDGRNRYYPGDKTRSYVNVIASGAAEIFVTLVKAADLTFEKIVDDILFDKRN